MTILQTIIARPSTWKFGNKGDFSCITHVWFLPDMSRNNMAKQELPAMLMRIARVFRRPKLKTKQKHVTHKKYAYVLHK